MREDITIMISNFYYTRHMDKFMIPLSTAVWDFPWFHGGNNQDHNFIDKKGVLLGLKHKYLVPGQQLEGLCKGIQDNFCVTNGCEPDPSICSFLRAYRYQLDRLNFEEQVIGTIEKIVDKYREKTGIKEDITVILLVHEAEDNSCSERHVLKQYFKEHDLELKTFKGKDKL